MGGKNFLHIQQLERNIKMMDVSADAERTYR